MKEYRILHQYLKEIGRFPLLSAEEEKDLAKRVLEGDTQAKKKLIESNLRLVVKIAIEMHQGRMPLMDIIQNGNLGLIRAVEKFDYRRNIRFSSYAAYWIKQSILRHFQEDGHLENISARLQEKKRQIRRFIESFFVQESRLPSAQELSQAMSLSLFEAAQELKAYQPQICEKPPSLLEDIPDTTHIESLICDQCLSEDLENTLQTLDEESRKLLQWRYGFEGEECATLSEIAEKLHITAEGVRQRENRLLALLRDKNPSLKYYLA
ncbi:MAG: sigma-70 family RNA polymerase sigma factor [Brevinematales bacterium]|nr:sigma-70 family RNA polymerase sigma factor [Brevinematales bacterium]